MNLHKLNDEVYRVQDVIGKFGHSEVIFLKQQAKRNHRNRARICAHTRDDDPINEMLIAIGENSYVRPHMHLGKTESFHIIEGLVDLVFFKDSGEISEVIELGDQTTDRFFYCRVPKGTYHSILPLTNMIVVHEASRGPFLREETIYADFSPNEEQTDEIIKYKNELVECVNQFKLAKKLSLVKKDWIL